MAKKNQGTLFPKLGKMLSHLQQTVAVDGEILTDRKLCSRVHMSTGTYSLLKKAGV